MLIAWNGVIFETKKNPSNPPHFKNINLFGKILLGLIVLLTLLNITKNLYDEKNHTNEVKILMNFVSELRTSFEVLIDINTRLRNELGEVGKKITIQTKAVEEIKILTSISDKRREVIKLAFDLQKKDIIFKWGGKNPEEGFDSSSFIAYILSRANIIQKPETYWSGRLRSEFGSKKFSSESELQIGDILFYEAGVCMLYLGGNRCIGMLPQGIVTAELEFGFQILGYGRVNYS